MSLNFPGDDYRSGPTDEFLEKIKRFENIILDKAVEYSEVWWGETMSREVIKHMFFPLLKYSKNKDTKKIDMTKPPAIRVKVPCYDGTWNVEVYDTKMTMLFPSEDESITPPELVPKLSNVACVIQCTGIWIGGKGWGVSWKLVQAIVKPREMQSVFGKCHVMLSNEEIKTLDAGEDAPPTVVQEEDVPQVKSAPPSKLKQTTIAPVAAPVVDQTTVEDSDEETEAPPPPALTRQESYAPIPTTAVQEPESPVVTEDAAVETTTVTEPAPAPAPTPTKTVVKKIVKKKAP